MLAPPWISVPPPGYGGIETVVALLCNGLVDAGHRVTLFAAPGSYSDADVRCLLETPHPDEINDTLFEADHVAQAFAEVELAAEQGDPYDVLHDHTGFTALAMADRFPVPVVHTLHGPFTEQTHAFYSRHGHKAFIVAISRHQLGEGPDEIPAARVIPNPIDAAAFPFRADKEDFVLWIGRMAPVKGAHRAIAAAKGAGVPLVIAGPVQPGQEQYFESEVKPHIDDDAVRYVGEVGGEEKAQLFARARGMLMPIRWPEPFGMVMVEAMACGTPVIAFPEGAAPEIVIDGETGFLVGDEHEMADAVARLGEIDPGRCREHVTARYDVPTVAGEYVEAYREAEELAQSSPAPGPRVAR
jgi:glycosyltransferase involved in cell wall biosynthesis